MYVWCPHIRSMYLFCDVGCVDMIKYTCVGRPFTPKETVFKFKFSMPVRFERDRWTKKLNPPIRMLDWAISFASLAGSMIDYLKRLGGREGILFFFKSLIRLTTNREGGVLLRRRWRNMPSLLLLLWLGGNAWLKLPKVVVGSAWTVQ